jgi:uncharacterized membrane protein
MLLLTVFAPLAMPWGKGLLIYSVTAWFVLWVAFFVQMERQSSQAIKVGIISDGVVSVFSIIVFIIVIAVRCLVHLILFNNNTERNKA